MNERSFMIVPWTKMIGRMTMIVHELSKINIWKARIVYVKWNMIQHDYITFAFDAFISSSRSSYYYCSCTIRLSLVLKFEFVRFVDKIGYKLTNMKFLRYIANKAHITYSDFIFGPIIIGDLGAVCLRKIMFEMIL